MGTFFSSVREHPCMGETLGLTNTSSPGTSLHGRHQVQQTQAVWEHPCMRKRPGPTYTSVNSRMTTQPQPHAHNHETIEHITNHPWRASSHPIHSKSSSFKSHYHHQEFQHYYWIFSLIIPHQEPTAMSRST